MRKCLSRNMRSSPPQASKSLTPISPCHAIAASAVPSAAAVRHWRLSSVRGARKWLVNGVLKITREVQFLAKGADRESSGGCFSNLQTVCAITRGDPCDSRSAGGVPPARGPAERHLPPGPPVPGVRLRVRQPECLPEGSGGPCCLVRYVSPSPGRTFWFQGKWKYVK